MQWPDVRAQYPEQWVLVEAVGARSEGNRRVIEQVAVIGQFPDSVVAMQQYQELHRAAPERELYVLHTSREVLDITERRWLGIRAAP